MYQPVFRAIIFTVFDCGFMPRTALEVSDTDDIRIEKIIRLIRESRYSIHDISRTEQDGNTRLPRFNMPFEFGIYVGAKRFGDKRQREKSCLVMDVESYRYRNFISDISGQDIRAHEGNPMQAIKCVRDWLHEKSNRTTMPGSHLIQQRYERFNADLPELCDRLGWDVRGLTFMEYTIAVTEWLKENTSNVAS
jgi:hypothetical protein